MYGKRIFLYILIGIILVISCSTKDPVSSKSDPGKIAFLAEISGTDNEVFMVSGDGSGEISQLTSNSINEITLDLCWDGSKLVTVANHNVDPDPWIDSTNINIYMIKNGSVESTFMITSIDTLSENEPSLSKNGEILAYSAIVQTGQYTYSRQIFVMGIDGSNKLRLDLGDGWCMNPDMSSDGNEIAFFASINGNRGIYKANYDGSHIEAILTTTNNYVMYYMPKWSPDDKKIAFWFVEASDPDNIISKVGIINADGTDYRIITPESTYAMFPSWSPDGNKLTFTGANDFNLSDNLPIPRSDIYTINLDGAGLKNITNTPGETEYWSSWGKNWVN